MNNACIIGNGIIGNATGEALGIKHRYDIDPKKSNTPLINVYNFRYLFICLPTPVNEDGSYLTQDIEDLILSIEGKSTRQQTYIIRSTVYPGFADKVKQTILDERRIISFPEFLSEDTAAEDALNPPFYALGATDADKNPFMLTFLEDMAINRRERDLSPFFSSRIFLGNNRDAEMTKLAMNSYFSQNVMFGNKLSDSCKPIKVNYNYVKEALMAHPYGPKYHMEPVYKGKRGIRGHCLPKDTKAFAHYTGSEMARLVLKLNKKYVKDE